MPSAESVRVTIFNQTYTLRSSDEPGRVQELAQMVDELMSSISRSGNLDSTRTAVLACLHLADRLRAMEEELSSLRVTVDTKAREFSLQLDRVINE